MMYLSIEQAIQNIAHKTGITFSMQDMTNFALEGKLRCYVSNLDLKRQNIFHFYSDKSIENFASNFPKNFHNEINNCIKDCQWIFYKGYSELCFSTQELSPQGDEILISSTTVLSPEAAIRSVKLFLQSSNDEFTAECINLLIQDKHSSNHKCEILEFLDDVFCEKGEYVSFCEKYFTPLANTLAKVTIDKVNENDFSHYRNKYEGHIEINLKEIYFSKLEIDTFIEQCDLDTEPNQTSMRTFTKSGEKNFSFSALEAKLKKKSSNIEVILGYLETVSDQNNGYLSMNDLYGLKNSSKLNDNEKKMLRVTVIPRAKNCRDQVSSLS